MRKHNQAKSAQPKHPTSQIIFPWSMNKWTCYTTQVQKGNRLRVYEPVCWRDRGSNLCCRAFFLSLFMWLSGNESLNSQVTQSSDIYFLLAGEEKTRQEPVRVLTPCAHNVLNAPEGNRCVIVGTEWTLHAERLVFTQHGNFIVFCLKSEILKGTHVTK